ncbi:MAG: uroporphyrinogen-III C-methyltransferase [Eubacteriales bacterium]|nr:uroporphyrinogen-III C-methyltransferase [Eubacteriales bacterium]
MKTQERQAVIRIGSRDSMLAVRQSELVIERLRRYYAEMQEVPDNAMVPKLELLTRKTIGDRILDRPLEEIGGKGLFIRELLEDMTAGRVDLAVHSLKDMETEEDRRFPIIAYLPREDARDVLVLPRGVADWDQSLPVGCSGKRRIEQLKRSYPGLHFKPIRGNVPTRLRKLDEGEYGAIILAAAGLKRLGLEERISRYFSVEEILPAAGQAIIAVQAAASWLAEPEYQRLAAAINDPRTEVLAEAERCLIHALGGGCHQPMAGYAYWCNEKEICLEGLYCLPQQGIYRKAKLRGEGTIPAVREMAERLADRLKAGQARVTLVGAGPGAADLLTVGGRRALRQAQAVLYDSLVGPEVLQFLPLRADLIHVGKRSGAHSMKQGEINRLLVETGKTYERVVRLKGGDPYLFGRGGEEAEELVKNGLDFDVISGVTAGISVPAYAGIPVTFRGLSTAVHLITGHREKQEISDCEWESYAKLEGSLVFYMSVAAIPTICERLCCFGKAASTPAALLIRGTTAEADRISGSLADITEKIEAYPKEKTPGLFLVGTVAALDGLQWYQPKPLGGRTLIVGRPKQASSVLTQRLRDLGAAVYEAEAIHTEALWQEMRIKGESAAAVAAEATQASAVRKLLAVQDWLVLTSPSAVYYLAEAMEETGLDARVLQCCRLAVTGRGTATALYEQLHIRADLIASKGSGRSLAEELLSMAEKAERILIAGVEAPSTDLYGVLSESGRLVVTQWTTYRTVAAQQEQPFLQEQARAGRIDAVVLTSASTVRGMMAMLGEDLFRTAQGFCIGSQTAAAAQGMQKVYTADQTTVDSLLELIVRELAR